MKNKKYHTVRTAPNFNRKTKNTTLLEQLQILIEKKSKIEAKSISLTHKYMTAYFPGLV